MVLYVDAKDRIWTSVKWEHGSVLLGQKILFKKTNKVIWSYELVCWPRERCSYLTGQLTRFSRTNSVSFFRSRYLKVTFYLNSSPSESLKSICNFSTTHQLLIILLSYFFVCVLYVFVLIIYLYNKLMNISWTFSEHLLSFTVNVKEFTNRGYSYSLGKAVTLFNVTSCDWNVTNTLETLCRWTIQTKCDISDIQLWKVQI